MVVLKHNFNISLYNFQMAEIQLIYLLKALKT